MEAQSKWLWPVTIANAAVASLLILVVYGMMLLLAVIAPEISGWPLVILLPISFVLSVMGLRFAKTAASRASRWLAFIVNACSLAFSSLIILSLAAMFVGSTNEAFLIPDEPPQPIFQFRYNGFLGASTPELFFLFYPFRYNSRYKISPSPSAVRLSSSLTACV